MCVTEKSFPSHEAPIQLQLTTPQQKGSCGVVRALHESARPPARAQRPMHPGNQCGQHSKQFHSWPAGRRSRRKKVAPLLWTALTTGFQASTWATVWIPGVCGPSLARFNHKGIGGEGVGGFCLNM
jgi:hypothetical protein